MVHLYCGEGKGKTTAAMGLALRMAGRGKRVVVAQFLKGADSGERYALAMLPQVTLLPLPERVKFSFQLTPEEREAEQVRYLGLAGAGPDTGGTAGLRTAGAGRGLCCGEHRPAPTGRGDLLPGPCGGGGGPHRAGPRPGPGGTGGLHH